MKQYCIDCFNFKTRIITNKNKRILWQLGFNRFMKIFNALKKMPEVRIFYCKYSRTNNPVYVNGVSVEKWNKSNPKAFIRTLSTLRKIKIPQCLMKDI